MDEKELDKINQEESDKEEVTRESEIEAVENMGEDKEIVEEQVKIEPETTSKKIEQRVEEEASSKTLGDQKKVTDTAYVTQATLQQQPFSVKEIPDEIKGWNWGAFAFNIFWGIGNKTYLPLLCLIPFFNIIWMFVCGFKGNEWAWKDGNYTSVEEFKLIQKTWSRAGIAQAILLIINFVFSIFMFVLMLFMFIFVAEEVDNNNYYEDSYGLTDDYYTSNYSIDDLNHWSQEIYDGIKLATSSLDLEKETRLYTDGTSYKDLIKKVGEPISTEREEDTITAYWETSDGSFGVYIDYDIPSGLIINKNMY